MNISIEDLRRFLFDERKTYEEISKIYKVSPNKIKKIIKDLGLSIDRVKKCKSCNLGNKKPPESSGGMSFDLSKD